MTNFDPYHKWLGIPPREQPPNHYRLLGIAVFEPDAEVIEAAADRQMTYVRQCASGPHLKESQKILNELSMARVCLLNPAKRQAYDVALKKRLQTSVAPPAVETPADPLSDFQNTFAAIESESVRPAAKTLEVKRPIRQTTVQWIALAAAGALFLVAGLIYFLVLAPGESGKQAGQQTGQKTGQAAGDRPQTPAATATKSKTSDEIAAAGSSSARPAKDAGTPRLSQPAKQITNSLGMDLVLIPAGEFLMGNPDDISKMQQAYPYQERFRFQGEGPQHRVRITKPFYMGTCEVTIGQFMKFHASGNCRIEHIPDPPRGDTWGYDLDKRPNSDPPGLPWAQGWDRIDNHPVVYIAWTDAQAFCEWLSRTEGRTYRLPTEAEWEYACRAGTKTRYWCGDDPQQLANIANFPDQDLKGRWPGMWVSAVKEGIWTEGQVPFPYLPRSDGYAFDAPVGKFQANPWGLFDMHGNVAEYCHDWAQINYYDASPVDDPAGPTDGIQRIYRGGGWRSSPAEGRSCDRAWISTDERNNCTGFRVVCDATEAAKMTTKSPSASQTKTAGPAAAHAAPAAATGSEPAGKTVPAKPAATAGAPPAGSPVVDKAALDKTAPDKPAATGPWANLPPLIPNPSQQQVIERILALQGEVQIKYMGSSQEFPIKSAKDLPTKEFYLGTVRLEHGTIGDVQAICRIRVEHLELTGPDLTDKHLALLSEAQGLYHVTLRRSACTAAGLQLLANCRELRSLSLIDSPFGDSDLAALHNLRLLTSLTLEKTLVTDAGLRDIARLQNLVSLRLTDCSINGEGLQEVRGKFSRLSICNLSQTNLSNAGLKHLTFAAPNLTNLILTSTEVSNEGLRALSGMRSLKFVDLTATHINDAGLTFLKRIPTLMRVYLPKEGCTPASVVQLRAAMPKCTVTLRVPEEIPEGN